MLSDERDNQETQFVNNQEKNIRNKMMIEALEHLKLREKDVIIKRRLIDNPKTLEELSQEYKVSRERIRQIETRAFEKLQEVMKIKAKELKLIGSNEYQLVLKGFFRYMVSCLSGLVDIKIIPQPISFSILLT